MNFVRIKMALPLTSANLLKSVKEFLSIWINQVLYYNRVYKSDIFDKFKSFNLVIYKNRNPQLEIYINDLLDNFFEIALVHRRNGSTAGHLNNLVIVIYNTKTNKILRKYVIKFSDLLSNLADTIPNNTMVPEDNSAAINIPHFTWNEIFTQINEALFKQINELKRNIGSGVNDENNDLFFKVFVDMQSTINLTSGNWVRVETHAPSRDNGSQKCKFVPISEVNLNLFNMDIYNEHYE